MSKLNKLLALALFVQVFLVVGVSFAREEGKTTKLTKLFEGFDPAKVTKLTIESAPKDPDDASAPPQTKVELAKDGSTWGIATADAYPADQTKVSELLEKVQRMKSRGPVLTSASAHKKVEVADTKYQRKITLVHDGKEMSFFLGTSPGFKSVHLRKAGENDVHSVNEMSSWEAGARAWDWVDRSFVKFGDKDVWGVKIANKAGTITLDKNADGAWSAEGVSGPIKKTALDDLVRKASTINLEEPVGKTEKPEHGLEAPLATITLRTGTSTIAGKMPDEMQTHVVRIGAKTSDNRYFVKASTSPYVVQAAGWAVEPLTSKTSKDLLDTPPKDEKKK